MEDPQIMAFPCVVRATGAGGGGEELQRRGKRKMEVSQVVIRCHKFFTVSE